MNKTTFKQRLADHLLITVGCAIYAAGIAPFLDANGLTPAGVSGLAIVINHLLGEWFGITSLATGTIILFVNVPLMLLGIWKFGIKFLYTTIYAIFVSSLFMNLLEPLGSFTDDLVLASLLGGAFMSLGMGLVLKTGATTGGSDIIARLLRLRYKHIKIGEIFWGLDAVVVVLSCIVFSNYEVALYALLTLTVQTFVLDTVLYGTASAKLVYIISEKEELIARRILNELEAGITYFDGKGGYTNNSKRVIMCAVKKQLLPKLREIVRDADPYAFMIVTKATEIFGEGFKDHKTEDI